MPSKSRGGKRPQQRPARRQGQSAGTASFADVAQVVVAAAGVINSLINAVSEYRRQQAETHQNAETQGHRDKNTLTCMVCKQSVSQLARSGVEILATPCGHVYCRDCIFQALRDKPECPECLSKLYIQNLNTLHF